MPTMNNMETNPLTFNIFEIIYEIYKNPTFTQNNNSVVIYTKTLYIK